MQENHRHKSSEKRLNDVEISFPSFLNSDSPGFSFSFLDLSVSASSVLLSGSSLTWTAEQLCSLSLPEGHTVVRAAQQQAEPTGNGNEQ